MRSDLELNNLTIRLRKKWGEDEYSSVDISKLASLQDNITLITIEMPSEMSGMCVKSDNEIIIAVNSTMSLGRQRFTIAFLCFLFIFSVNPIGTVDLITTGQDVLLLIASSSFSIMLVLKAVRVLSKFVGRARIISSASL